jgi:hypothetical protein
MGIAQHGSRRADDCREGQAVAGELATWRCCSPAGLFSRFVCLYREAVTFHCPGSPRPPHKAADSVLKRGLKVSSIRRGLTFQEVCSFLLKLNKQSENTAKLGRACRCDTIGSAFLPRLGVPSAQ